MSRDSRPSDQLAEELRDLDAGMQVKRPRVDWASAVSARRSRRQTVRAAVVSLIVLAMVLPAAWYATQPGNKRIDVPIVDNGLRTNPTAGSEAKQELLALDREISQIERNIVSMKRSQRKLLAEKTAKRAKPSVVQFADPVEEGALVMLAAAEKAQRADQKETSLVLFRRVVELFPETRSADIARRQLM